MIDVSALSKSDWIELIERFPADTPPDLSAWPFVAARRVRDERYGRAVFLRGLVEFTSFCARDCLYCGLRRSNDHAVRYRLAADEILACCAAGAALGFKSFVLQGGEDAFFTDDVLCGIVSALKARQPDCTVTLSAGERSAESYRRLRAAGADRYLLRHETADAAHYARLHPRRQTLENRKRCLYALKEAGFHIGAGFMVGSPGQTVETLAEDMLFLKELQPQMVGIGPFMPHAETPFAHEPAGSAVQTLLMVALTRLLLPNAMLPATTALASVHPKGRIWGLESGANVIMPNLSPTDVRTAYRIYDGKRAFASEAAEGLALLQAELAESGYITSLTRGDWVGDATELETR